ncbi:MAG TPA: phosphoadenylyl-sulfate reductase [Alphaproteobacteria bacterium]|jgi:phosphoadenosine phosphosulfate reductase
MSGLTNPTNEALETLRAAAGAGVVTLASSFSVEDMVLTDLIDRHGLSIGIFTLDTGRLPEETYTLMQQTRARYRTPVEVYAPQAAAVEAYVATNGPNAFYDSVELRQACCAIRKVEPLKRALAGKQGWVTGQRRQHSVTRRDLPLREWDADNAMHKFNPLAAWSNEDVWAYVRANDIPYNALHDRGYASIGCGPCTRAITVGEDIRAGRWWWENPETKECGLHPHANPDRKAS